MSRNKVKPWTPFERGSRISVGVDGTDTDETWVNSRYQVFVYRKSMRDGTPVAHLSIKRNDRRHIHDWRELQRIKNELCGTDCEAIELYPAESNKVDSRNQYHLWALPPGTEWGLGFQDGRLVDNDPGVAEKINGLLGSLPVPDRSKQRKWEPHHTSAGCEPIGPVWRNE